MRVDGKIRLVGDRYTPFPLWDSEGQLSDDPDWLRETLGISDDLISRINAWGHRYTLLTGPVNSPSRSAEYRVLEAERKELIRELRVEVKPSLDVLDY